MKKNLVIILLIISSFILGLHYKLVFYMPALLIEFIMFSDIFNKSNSIWNVLNIAWLAVSHLGLFALLFSGKLRSSKVYLVLMPLSFMLAYASNAIIFIFMEPVLLFSFIPFIILWIYAITKPYDDTSLTKFF